MKIIIKNLHVTVSAPASETPKLVREMGTASIVRAHAAANDDFREWLLEVALKHGINIKLPSAVARKESPASPAPAPHPTPSASDDVPSDAWQRIKASRPGLSGQGLELLRLMFRQDPAFAWRVLMRPAPVDAASPIAAHSESPSSAEPEPAAVPAQVTSTVELPSAVAAILEGMRAHLESL